MSSITTAVNETSGVRARPKLRENIWHIDPEKGRALLVTPQATFEVPAADALRFLKMRSYCTGHLPVDEIARRSGLSLSEVESIVRDLDGASVVCPEAEPRGEVPPEVVHPALVKICGLWSDELRHSYVGNELMLGQLPKTVLLGWLVEMYHYIRDFPEAIAYAASRATGELRAVLLRYARQEEGHDKFVVRTLVNLGLTEEEVRTSTPLVSTRTVGYVMRDLFGLEPAGALMAAALVEAQDFDDIQTEAFTARMHELYGVPTGAFAPFFEHQEIDVSMGHSRLLEENLALVRIPQLSRLNVVVNLLHDLKHAFDLQGLEIKSYYAELEGKYFPRQPMDFAAIRV